MWQPQIQFDLREDSGRCFGSKNLGEVCLHFCSIESQLAEPNKIIPDAIFPSAYVRRSDGTAETIQPTQKGQAERSATALTDLFVDISFLATEPAELRMKSRPSCAATREQPQIMHGNFKSRRCWIGPARIFGPSSKHTIAPTR